MVSVNFMAVDFKPESDRIQSTPGKTLSTTFCHLVSYRGYFDQVQSNPDS